MFYIVGVGGNVGGPDIPTEELVAMSKQSAFLEGLDWLRKNVKAFNETSDVEVMRKQLEQIGYIREINFPQEIGYIPYKERLRLPLKKGQRKPLEKQFIMENGYVHIQKLKEKTGEYEEIARFPMDQLKLDVRIVREKYDKDIHVYAFWKTGSMENAALDSCGL